MRRRFAGEGIGSTTTVPADTLAAATEALKAAQSGLKGSRGGRLGQGSELEREEAIKSKAAGSEATLPAVAAAPIKATSAGTTDISSLRKALGIDDLLTSLRGIGTGSAEEMPEFEMPQFEMPEFEMPKFEMPDFANMFESAFSRYAPPESLDTTSTTSQTAGVPSKSTGAPLGSKASKVTVGNKSYNLAKMGGAGLGSGDIKLLTKKGWSKSEIRKAAKQAPSVSTGAQKFLNTSKKTSSTKQTPSKKAQDTAKKLTSSASLAIAKAAPKPAQKAAQKAAPKPAQKAAPKPAQKVSTAQAFLSAAVSSPKKGKSKKK
jgi:hypothetical protein